MVICWLISILTSKKDNKEGGHLQKVTIGQVQMTWGFPGGTNGKEPACQYKT